jgi:hypothetical protein
VTDAGRAGPRTEPLEGITAEVLAGWEVRIRRARASNAEEVTKPVLHAATVPLLPERADFGDGVVETLGPGDVFVSLVEYGPDAVNSALFAPVDVFPPVLESNEFRPKQLQRVIPGQAGQQVFFSYLDRAFCLYAVIGSAALVDDLTEKANRLIGGIQIASP